MSVSEKYVAFSANDTLTLLDRSNRATKCTYHHQLPIIAVKTFEIYTVFTTEWSTVQFDNDICEVVHEIQIP